MRGRRPSPLDDSGEGRRSRVARVRVDRVGERLPRIPSLRPAAVAELVDAHGFRCRGGKPVEVRVLSAALGGPDRSRAGRLDRARLPRQEVDHPLRNDRDGDDLIVRSGDDGGSGLLPWNPYRDRGRLWPRKPHRKYQGGGGDLVRATTRPRGCEAQLGCLMSEGGEVSAVERVGGRRGTQ